jgi:hypothetical protein
MKLKGDFGYFFENVELFCFLSPLTFVLINILLQIQK